MIARGARIRAASVLGLLLVAGCGAGPGPATTPPPPSRAVVSNGATASRPDVLLVTLDTLRLDRVAATTPSGRPLMVELSTFAAGARDFRRAVTPTPLTVPAHVSLLTSRRPIEHEVVVNTEPMTRRFPSVAESFAAAGWETAAFVSTRLLGRGAGFQRGFVHFSDAVDPETGERDARATTDEALAWFSARPRERPLFVWVHFYDPHWPYLPPGATDLLPEGYDDEARFVDEQFGRLLDGWRQARGGESIVAVVADHGEALGDEGEMTHGFFLPESTIRIPMLLAGPGIPAGTDDSPTGLIDLAPTIARLAGVPFEAGSDARDLLAGDRAGRVLVSETWHPARTFGWAEGRAYWNGLAKLVVQGDVRWFDLVADPAAIRDLRGERPIPEPLRARREAEERLGRPGERGAASPRTEAQAALFALGYANPLPSGAGMPASRAETVEQVGRVERAINGTLLAREMRRRGRADLALGILAEVVDLNPGFTAARLQAGLALLEAGRAREALVEFREATAGDASNPDGWFLLGNTAALFPGGEAEAEDAFDRVLARSPDLWPALVSRAKLLERLGRREEACRDFAQVLRIAPGEPESAEGIRRCGAGSPAP